MGDYFDPAPRRGRRNLLGFGLAGIVYNSVWVYSTARFLVDVALVEFTFRRNFYSLTRGPVLGCTSDATAAGELVYNYPGYRILVGQIVLRGSALSTFA